MNQRKSNIELLRILSMLMIIAHHLVGHGLNYLNDKSLWYAGNYINRASASFYILGGNVGVFIFFMISGYFLCNDNKVRLKKIIETSYFYGILTCGLFCIYNTVYSRNVMALEDVLLIIFRPITSGKWWFITSYFWLMLIHPVINNVLEKTNKRGLQFVVFGTFIIYTISAFFSFGMLSMDKAILGYLLGAYVKKYNSRNGKMIWILGFVLAWFIGAVGYYFIPGKMLIVRSGIGIFLGLLCAYFIFVFFTKISFSNGIINMLAKSTLGVYLFHDSNLLRYIIWNELLKVPELYNTPYFPVLSVLYILLLFIVVAGIDFIRRKFIVTFFDTLFCKCVRFLNVLAGDRKMDEYIITIYEKRRLQH